MLILDVVKVTKPTKLVFDGAIAAPGTVFFLAGQGHCRLDSRGIDLKDVVIRYLMVAASNYDNGRIADGVLACGKVSPTGISSEIAAIFPYASDIFVRVVMIR
jgi:hypothetical protein